MTLLVSVALLAGCATSAPRLPTAPNEREWTALQSEYDAIASLRSALPQPPAGATRRQVLELHLENQKQLEPRLEAFLGRAREYLDRTGDARAARLLANEWIRLGDSYVAVLARHDRAIELYRRAAQIDPSNSAVQARIENAERRRYVSMDDFAAIRSGMREAEVERRMGIPREDWIKHLREGERLFSVWIYPRSDGGAAAVYFENGIVYHTNWNAAAPQASP
ncbi:MAG TPA: tetratricopeptide repeat protein [Thermoanaerobaculia bacterium]|nr:tetratricopeptide repeat protein [Thermoanaerobaculia bacterium]